MGAICSISDFVECIVGSIMNIYINDNHVLNAT